MKVSLKKAFNLLDGRLSTNMDDVYEMLNYIFDENFMTHQLPFAMEKLKESNPKWFSDGIDIINDVKRSNQTNDFSELMVLIDKGFPNFEIQLHKYEI